MPASRVLGPRRVEAFKKRLPRIFQSLVRLSTEAEREREVVARRLAVVAAQFQQGVGRKVRKDLGELHDVAVSSARVDS